MNIIKPKYEILEQKYNKESLLIDMFKHIEICGRTCYRSEDKITDTSYEKFINMLMKANHGAMLEHGTVYLTIPLGTPVDDPQYMWKMDIVRFFQNNKYSKVNSKTVHEEVDVEIKGYGMRTQASAHFYFITTNWRVIFENKDFEVMKYIFQEFKTQKESLHDSVLEWMTEPTDEHEKRYTVRFTYHLAVARDINRHRVQSIGEESTRYCNYSKEKFSEGPQAELNIIEPVFLSDDEKDYLHDTSAQLSLKELCKYIANEEDNVFNSINYWSFANLACEYAYMKLTKEYNWTAQQASLILPLDTKTCSVHTAFASDWCHFFNLRALGTTGAPRPSAKEVAWPLMHDFMLRKYITEDDINKERYQQILNEYPNRLDYIKK